MTQEMRSAYKMFVGEPEVIADKNKAYLRKVLTRANTRGCALDSSGSGWGLVGFVKTEIHVRVA